MAAPSVSPGVPVRPIVELTIRSIKRAPMLTEKDDAAVLQLPVDQVWLDVETVVTYTPPRCDPAKYAPRHDDLDAGGRHSQVLFAVKDVKLEVSGKATPASQGAHDVTDLWPGQQGERPVTLECDDDKPKSPFFFHFYFIVPEELLPKMATLTFADQRLPLEPFAK